MAAKQSEELIDEAHGNLSSDRQRMRTFLDKLINLPGGEEGSDSFSTIALADAVAKMSAELTKNNSLLVEIAKLRSKKELFKNSNEGFDDDEAGEMFDEIEDDSHAAGDGHN